MRTCRGFKNAYILHLAGSAVGHSEKFDAEISSRFLPTCTHIPRLKVGRNLHIDWSSTEVSLRLVNTSCFQQECDFTYSLQVLTTQKAW